MHDLTLLISGYQGARRESLGGTLLGFLGPSLPMHLRAQGFPGIQPSAQHSFPLPDAAHDYYTV